MELVKIIHAETNPLIREGIKVLLANEELDFDIKGVDSKDELNNLLESTSSNFLIFGYGLTSEFNKQLLKEVKLNFPHIKILIIASDLSKSQILQLLDFEIDGYLTNKCDLTEIKNAIRK